jgi:hypothetical protein
MAAATITMAMIMAGTTGDFCAGAGFGVLFIYNKHNSILQ